MTIYAISDLHLSFAAPKPMDMFGPAWENHPERVAQHWDETVRPEDVVIVAGDISWAMKLQDAMPDLDYLAQRPGRKLLVRGNHDYWWGRQGKNKIQRIVDPSITLLQGSGVVIDGVGIAGTRGWRLEDVGRKGASENDTTIFERELDYLRNGLRSLPEGLDTRIAVLHYPPFDVDLTPNAFRQVLEECGAHILIYGHIHAGPTPFLEGDVDGIRYILASVDHTGFAPVKVLGEGVGG